jgi:hypothetical protein
MRKRKRRIRKMVCDSSCKIWGFHSGDYEEWSLLGCYAVVALVRTDVSEELSASIVCVTRIGELGTTLAVTSNRRTLRLFLEEPHGVTSQKTPFFIVILHVYIFASVFIMCSNECVYWLKKFENVILFSKHAPPRLKGSRNLVRIPSF